LECIKGNGPDDLEKIVSVQAAILLCDAGIASTQEQGEEMILRTFKDGTALEKFLQILGNQGITIYS
jgi:pyrimidine-nucleoside phosphorylase